MTFPTDFCTMGGSPGDVELILQPFRHFTYITAHSPTIPLLHLRHSSFSNPSVASPTSQFFLQTFRRISYVKPHSPFTFVAITTSQLTLQPFHRFSYVTSSSIISPGEPPMVNGLLCIFSIYYEIWNYFLWYLFVQ